MSMLANVRRGKIIRPVFMGLYGPECVGKTTTASKAPNPIFLCAGTEQGTDQLDVTRLPPVECYDDLMKALGELMNDPHDYKTLIVDSLDALEPLIHTEICRRHNTTSIYKAAKGFGRGLAEAQSEWRSLIKTFNLLRDRRGMNIILIAHPEVKEVFNPLIQATIQRYQLKLDKKSMAIIRESLDALFFLGYEMFTQEIEGAVQAVYTEKRLLQGVPDRFHSYDAKNRYGLKKAVPVPEDDWNWDEFVSLCNVSPVGILEDIRTEVTTLMSLLEDADKKTIADERAKRNWDDAVKLSKLREQLKAITADKE